MHLKDVADLGFEHNLLNNFRLVNDGLVFFCYVLEEFF